MPLRFRILLGGRTVRICRGRERSKRGGIRTTGRGHHRLLNDIISDKSGSNSRLEASHHANVFCDSRLLQRQLVLRFLRSFKQGAIKVRIRISAIAPIDIQATATVKAAQSSAVALAPMLSAFSFLLISSNLSDERPGLSSMDANLT